MKTNKKRLILLALCVAAQIYLGRCIVLSRWAMERHWCEMLGGGFEPSENLCQFVTATAELPALPAATEHALRFGSLIPVLGLISVLAAAFFWRQPECERQFIIALLVVTLLSLALTAYYCAGISGPPLSITYRLSG